MTQKRKRKTPQRSEILPGDLIGFLGRNNLSQVICLGTGGFPFWPFYAGVSHVGIVGEWRNRQYVFEATTLEELPCAIRKRHIRGTQAHPLKDLLQSYRGTIRHYPLIAPLYAHEKRRLNAFLLDHLGLPYDEIGALRSGDGFSWLESYLRHDQLANIFCSELCAAAHNVIGRFDTDNVSRWNPNKLIRAERRAKLIRRGARLK